MLNPSSSTRIPRHFINDRRNVGKPPAAKYMQVAKFPGQDAKARADFSRESAVSKNRFLGYAAKQSFESRHIGFPHPIACQAQRGVCGAGAPPGIIAKALSCSMQCGRMAFFNQLHDLGAGGIGEIRRQRDHQIARLHPLVPVRQKLLAHAVEAALRQLRADIVPPKPSVLRADAGQSKSSGIDPQGRW